MEQMKHARRVIAACGLGLACVGASAQHQEAWRTIVTDEGVFTVPAERPNGPVPGGPVTREGWFYDTGFAIGATVAFSAEHAWAGLELNDQRVSIFDIDGRGEPIATIPGHANSPSGVASSADGDIAVYFDNVPGDVLELRVYDVSNPGQPLWSVEFDPAFVSRGSFDKRNVALSRDGSTLGVAVRDPVAEITSVVFFDVDTVSEISRFEAPEISASLDLTHDGSRAMLSLSNRPVVLDTADASVIFETAGSGGGNVDYRISGDGDVLVVGGFDLEIYQWDGSTYNSVIFHPSGFTEWMGFGAAVSADGSTVGSLSHSFSSQEMYIRLWDVDSGTLIGQDTLPPAPGSFQTAPQRGQASDDGAVFAFATWSDGTGVYPEVMVYNREVEQIASIEMPGSANDVDLMPDGSWVIATGKAVHANEFGNGGQVVALQLDDSTPCIADWNGDGEVDINDFFAYLGDFESGDPRADLNNDGEIDINDFFIFLSEFEAGC